ncbi:MAG: 50S ribosomal protein L1 [Candidatus Bathyarchaeia archaeon]
MPIQKSVLTQKIVELKKSVPKRNFKQSIELLMSLKGLDLKKPESRMEFSVEMPYPIGKPVKVCVIATGDLALKAKGSGADLVLDRGELDELAKDRKRAKKIAEEHDHFIAEASLMPLVGRVLGSVLGPRGKMPTPVPPNVAIEDLIKRYRRTVKIRVRDQPAVRCRVATEDMPEEHVAENVQAIISSVESKLEKGDKNVSRIRLKATMGRPVDVPLE